MSKRSGRGVQNIIRDAAATALLASIISVSAGALLPALADSPPPVKIRATNETPTVLSGSATVDDLSRNILKSEAELFKLTTMFRLHNQRETAVHRSFVAAMSTLAYSVANAGNITTFVNAYRYHSTPELFGKGRSETGPFMIFLGEIFFVGRTTGGALLDLSHSMHEKGRGFDRVAFENRANSLRSEIDSMLNRRQELLSAGGGTADAEQVVLKDVSDCASLEFVSTYARASRLKTFRISDNIMHSYTAWTGAFWGGLLEYMAATKQKPRLAGPAGLGFIASGSGFILGDAVPYWGGKFVQKRVRARMLKQYGPIVDAPDRLERDKAALATAAGTSSSPGLSQRLAAYTSIQACVAEYAKMSANEEREMTHRYVHDQIINAIEGGANIAAGAVLADAGFDFHNSQDPFIQLHQGQKFLTKFGDSALIFTPTASAGILDTPLEAVYGANRYHSDEQHGLGYKGVTSDRLTRLDQIEHSI